MVLKKAHAVRGAIEMDKYNTIQSTNTTPQKPHHFMITIT